MIYNNPFNHTLDDWLAENNELEENEPIDDQHVHRPLVDYGYDEDEEMSDESENSDEESNHDSNFE